MSHQRPYSIHFIILIVGQIISIVGNSIVAFSLTLYLLEVTGSATVFGIITAISAIPWAIAGPIGGTLADRHSKKRIMVTLDFLTAGLLVAVALIGFDGSVVLVIGATKFLLAIIQSMYAPSVSASLVYLVEPTYLVRANAITSQINSISRILGPILAGFLYSLADIHVILWIGGGIFFVCALLECFMQIPKVSRSVMEGVQKASYTLKESVGFLVKENRYLFLFLCCVALAGLAINSIITIGLPFIVNLHLALPSQYYGICNAVAGIGSLVAGMLLFVCPHKLSFQKSGLLYLGAGGSLLLMGISLYLLTGLSVFVALCVTVFLLMVVNGVIYILMYAFIQKITPPNMLGKLMSCVVIFAGFADPIGQILYGFLFDLPALSPAVITLSSGVFVLLLSGLAATCCRKAVEMAKRI